MEDSEKKNTFAYYAVDFLAGCFGGSAGILFGYPLDTVKVNQQIGQGNTILQQATTVYKHGGVSRFYKGLTFPMAAEGFRACIAFGVYGNIMKKLGGDQPHGERIRQVAVAGAVGGWVQSIPAVPIELVKIKMQAQATKPGVDKLFTGPFDCLRHIFREHGLRGCFRGVTPLMIRDSTSYCVYMLIFKYYCDREQENKLSEVFQECVIGGLAGVVSWLNMPLDVVKTRMQEDNLSNPRYKSTLDCVRLSYRADGMRVFWRGLTAACVRAFPVNAVTFVVYSQSLKRMERHIKSDN